MCVLDWSLLGKPSRKGLKEKDEVSPHWRTGLLWKPSSSERHPWADAMAHILQLTYAACELPKVCPVLPFHGARGAVMLTWGWGVMGVSTGTVPRTSSMVLLRAQSHLACWTPFLGMRQEIFHWVLLLFVRLTHKEWPLYGCLKELILRLFCIACCYFWEFLKICSCQHLPLLFWFVGHKETVNLN